MKTTGEHSDALPDERRKRKSFRLRRASHRGKGLQPGVSPEWDRLREVVYEGREDRDFSRIRDLRVRNPLA